MTREEMWKEFENQLIRETRTPLTMSFDDAEKLTKLGIEETVAKWKKRLEQTRWIPVSEKLPKYNTPILLALKQIGKERTIVIGERRTRKSGWYFVDIAAYDTEHEVMAWMPLPEPYKAESEEING